MAGLLLVLITLTLSKCTSATQKSRSPITGASFRSSSHFDSTEVLQDEGVIAFPGSFERSNYQQYPHENFYHNYHNHNRPHNNENLHGNHGFKSQSERFDETSKGNQRQESNYDNSSIPTDLFWRMNNYTDLNDLLITFVDDYEEEAQLENRFSGGERNAAIVPKPAACIPELQTVQIATDEDPSVIYIPTCTRIERCGGCCSHSLFSCQPTDTETVSFQVVKTQFMGGSKLKFMGKEIKLVERHTKCKCDCKVKEQDCNRFQQYKKSECRCSCVNTDEEKKCYKENATKLWNPEICACQCRNILQCSTGYTYDMFSCKCVPVLVRRRFAELEVDDQGKDFYKVD